MKASSPFRARHGRFALFVLVAILLVMVFQAVYYAPRLPETVASHFGPGGQPDGWSSKTTFFTLYAVVVVVTVGSFLLLPLFLRRLPDHLINLPGKDYWLAPERRDETFRTMGVHLLWLANGTLMFLAYVLGIAMAANLEPEPRLGSSFWWSFGLYVAFTIGWTVVFVRRFYRTE